MGFQMVNEEKINMNKPDLTLTAPSLEYYTEGSLDTTGIILLALIPLIFWVSIIYYTIYTVR